jgi:hypothetical protein
MEIWKSGILSSAETNDKNDHCLRFFNNVYRNRAHGITFRVLTDWSNKEKINAIYSCSKNSWTEFRLDSYGNVTCCIYIWTLFYLDQCKQIHQWPYFLTSCIKKINNAMVIKGKQPKRLKIIFMSYTYLYI